MAATLPLADHATRDDLRVFLERLERAGEKEVRLVSHAATLAVYGCTQAPRGITDTVPVVLVLRVLALSDMPRSPIDTTVMSRSLLDRIARLGIAGLDLELPDSVAMVPWAGVLPPVGGWKHAGKIDSSSLITVAKQGIARVAAALPENPGELVVHRIRASVWGSEIAPGIPAALAFAAEAMGFLREEEAARISRSTTWTRVTTDRGHVLLRGRG